MLLLTFACTLIFCLFIDPAASSPLHAHSNKARTTAPITKRLVLEDYSKLDSDDLKKVRDFGRQNKNEHANVIDESEQVQLHQHHQVPKSVYGKSEGSVSRRSQRPRTGAAQRSRSLSQSTIVSVESSERSRTPSYSSANKVKGRRISKDESIATEDFDQIFKSTRTPSSLRFMQPFVDVSSSKKRKKKKEHGPVKADHQIHVSEQQMYIDESPSTSRHHRSRKHRKSNTEPSRPSGLPEYMYLRKDIGESDLGSDSIVTEDYEGLFAAAMIPAGAGGYWLERLTLCRYKGCNNTYIGSGYSSWV